MIKENKPSDKWHWCQYRYKDPWTPCRIDVLNCGLTAVYDPCNDNIEYRDVIGNYYKIGPELDSPV